MSDSIPSKNIERSIAKGVKKVIAASGLDPSTRSGNKELNHWITSLSSQSFPSLQSAISYGEHLGQKIVERSQAMNKAHLDRGVIRHLRLHSDLPAIPAAPAPPAKVAQVSVPQVVTQTVTSTSEENSAAPVTEAVKSFIENPSIKEPMSKPDAEPIVSIPVNPEPASEEVAEVSDIEDSEPTPTDPEAAKVEIDPTPHIESAPEEPTSVVETVVAEQIMATAEIDSEEIESEDEIEDDGEEEEEDNNHNDENDDNEEDEK